MQQTVNSLYVLLNMSTNKALIDLSVAQLSVAGEMAGDMSPPLDGTGRPQCALFLTIVELFEAAVLLAQAGLVTHGSTHVRSMLEALVDQRLLATSENYVDRMQFKRLTGEIAMLERSLEVPGVDAELQRYFTERLAECEVRLDPIRAKLTGAERRASMESRFDGAGLNALLGHYKVLCSFSHNDLNALAFRHQGDTAMTLRAPDRLDMLFHVLSLAHVVLVSATEPVKESAHFPTGRFDHHLAQMVELQRRVLDYKDDVLAWQQSEKIRK